MNWKTVEEIAANTDKKWYLIQKEVAGILGICRQEAAAFLSEQSVPYHKFGKKKVYFLPEVLEAVDRNKWKD